MTEKIKKEAEDAWEATKETAKKARNKIREQVQRIQ